jgi:uncharacterized protein
MKMFQKTWRLIKKYYYKLIRADGSPHAIALGVALGLFLGTAIPLGQAVLAILFAIIFRANKVVAFAVTWVSNPYTTPFMYLGFCYLGSRILGTPLSYKEIEYRIKDIFTSFSFEKCWDTGFYILLSYIVGGAIIGGIAAIAGYFISKKLVIKYKKLRKTRMLKRRDEVKKSLLEKVHRFRIRKKRQKK